MKNILLILSILGLFCSALACDDHAEDGKKEKRTTAAAKTSSKAQAKLADSKEKVTTPAFEEKKCTETAYSKDHTTECKIEKK